jgi:ABC-type methionine transport system ATPase subunit
MSDYNICQGFCVDKLNEKHERVEIIKGVSFEVQRDEIFCMVGPSGGGKSLLVRTINRLEEMKSGRIFLDGRSILDFEPFELRKQVGMVLQTPALFDATVLENITYGPKIWGISESERNDRAAELVQLMGLETDLLGRHALSLSIGQQQRVSIARTLANDPHVLLFDEITSALDPPSVNLIGELTLDIRDRLEKTIVFVTHNMGLAQRVGDRVGLLANGEMVEVGGTEEFFSNPKTDEGKRFLLSIEEEER